MSNTEQIKAHNIIFDGTLHYTVPAGELEEKKVQLGDSYEFIKGFHCLDDAFDYEDELNETV
ncbi:MAG: hypothetical protein N4A74_20595 [Carboxylicivirga sp.]|jgi:hypothetical protein|nr:hypothetical protein [Carboxylicivirga sp.]